MARAPAVTPVAAATTKLDLSNDPIIKGKAGASLGIEMSWVSAISAWVS
jgi:hypothetical protein